MELLLKGLILGFSIAAPVGPIGLLCIRRTLAEGKMSGFVSGLGAASADALYGFIAAFGLTAISAFLLEYEKPIQVLGGGFLIYLAINIFFASPARKAIKLKSKGTLWKSYLSTFFLTATNPATILSFIAAFSGLGIVSDNHTYTSAVLIVLGVFVGSALWWILLTTGIGLLKNRVTTERLIWVNRISGILIGLLGLISLGSSLGIL